MDRKYILTHHIDDTDDKPFWSIQLIDADGDASITDVTFTDSFKELKDLLKRNCFDDVITN